MKVSEIMSYKEKQFSGDKVKDMLHLACHIIDNLVASKVRPQELTIVKNELQAFGIQVALAENETVNLQRLKSSLDRGIRNAKEFTSFIIQTF